LKEVALPSLPLNTRRSDILTGDGWLLFATRSMRMFAYGFLSVVLVLYLTAEGLSEKEIGFLLTMTLLGDTAISLWITTAADRIPRAQKDADSWCDPDGNGGGRLRLDQ
jgi:hypothetical protein